MLAQPRNGAFFQDADEAALSSSQLRAFAAFMRSWAGGADGFVKSLLEARARAGRLLADETLWRQIAEEISLMETSEKLSNCLGPSLP